ncbi:uncharacterized protein LOC134538626 isoform X2 [Bacillus rossius redtenbacheri]|uniref:uncharacterized protein LOC134538626 isoform X2 n=1 Tax=Bacillus rossius redtenbacheri TaxID=93214 RepID=UPI002FDE2729
MSTAPGVDQCSYAPGSREPAPGLATSSRPTIRCCSHVILALLVLGAARALPTPLLPRDTPQRTDKALEFFQQLLPPYDQEAPLAREDPEDQDSPVYYIRLPAAPYAFVPGLGYVSQAQRGAASQLLSPPVSFLANGKPSAVYQWSSPGDFQSPVHALDQGPYVFNGRPHDAYLLRDSYNSLYADALQGLYP